MTGIQYRRSKNGHLLIRFSRGKRMYIGYTKASDELRKSMDHLFMNTSNKHWHLQNFLHVGNSLQSRLRNV